MHRGPLGTTSLNFVLRSVGADRFKGFGGSCRPEGGPCRRHPQPRTLPRAGVFVARFLWVRFRSRRISSRRSFLRSSNTSVPRRIPRSWSRGLFARRSSLSLISQLSIACSSAFCMLVPRLATAMRSSRCFAEVSRSVVTTLSPLSTFMMSLYHPRDRVHKRHKSRHEYRLGKLAPRLCRGHDMSPLRCGGGTT